MTEFLVFALYAPLASWGEIAVGETRGSWDRPSRSAVLGFIAGALGVSRDDQHAHDELDRTIGVAVRLDVPGHTLVDYQTTQSVAAQIVRKRGLVTRAERMAVESHERNTILSRRTYRQSSVATMVVWVRAESKYSLEAFESAIRRPHFVPFAGRKANVLGLPVSPAIVLADTLADAFADRERSVSESPMALFRPSDGWGREVAHDPCDAFATGLERPFRREVRRDGGAERTRWQFTDRVVEIGMLPRSTVVDPKDVSAEAVNE